MKLNISGWYKGIIGLENSVLDLGRCEIRPRASEQDIKNYYEECITRLRQYPQYFEDQAAFQLTLEELLDSKRATLVARNPIFPGFSLLRRREKYVTDEIVYFSLEEGHPLRELASGSPRGVIRVSPQELKANPEKYKSRIEVSNDLTQPEMKHRTFHATVHYVIATYQQNSGRLLTENLVRDGNKGYLLEMSETFHQFKTGG